MKSIARFLGMRRNSGGSALQMNQINNEMDKWNHTNMNGMKKLIKYLDIQLNESYSSPAAVHNRASPVSLTPQTSGSLFDDIEVTEDILNILELVESDQITDFYLQSIPSIRSLTMAFKRLILTHEPVIPYQYYDHFLSPVANYEKLIQQINKTTHYFLDYTMNFLTKLILNPNLLIPVQYIAKMIGVYLLRPESVSLYTKNDIDDMNHRQTVFLTLAEKYCQIHRQNQTFKIANEPVVASNTPFPATVPTASIQDRSIKVSFPSNNKPTQEFLQQFFSQYGSVVNIGSKEKFAVILFTDINSALRCIEEDVLQKLGKDYRIKYLGNRSTADVFQNNSLLSANEATSGHSSEAVLNDSSIVESVPPEISGRARSDTATSKESNISNLPRPKANTSKVKDGVEVATNGIAAVSSNDSHSVATSAVTVKNNKPMNETEDSFRLAKRQPEESLGIIDVSMISRYEDHNLTKVTMMNGETPARPMNHLPSDSVPKNLQSVKSLTQGSNQMPASNILTPSRRPNSSFISDSGSETSEDVKGSTLRSNAVHAFNKDSFSSKDESVSVIDDNKGAVSEKTIGWKTAQASIKTTIATTGTPYAHQVPISNISLTNVSTADSSITHDHPAIHATESSDESSYEGEGGILPITTKEVSQPSPRGADSSLKKVVPAPIHVDDIEDENHNILQTNFSRSAELPVQSPTTSSKRSIKTVQVGTSPVSSPIAAEDLRIENNAHSRFPTRYVDEQIPEEIKQFNADSNEEFGHAHYEHSDSNRMRRTEQDPSHRHGDSEKNRRSSLSSARTVTPARSSNLIQQFNENELLQRLQYLEAKCSHYELTLSQSKEILQQNETLFKQKLIHLELSNQQLNSDYQTISQEYLHLKAELFNKNIYITSLESMQKSLNNQLQQIQSKVERQSLSVILTQKKLIENLQQHFSSLQLQYASVEEELLKVQQENQELINENLLLKERVINQSLVIKELSKENKNEFHHHFPSSPLSSKRASSQQKKEPSSEDVNSEDDMIQEKTKVARESSFEDPTCFNEDEAGNNLAVLDRLSQNELKTYFSKLSMDVAVTYRKDPNRNSINKIIDRSDLTKPMSNLFPSLSGFQPQSTDYQLPVTATHDHQPIGNVPEKEFIPQSINERASQEPLLPSGTASTDNEPKLSYSAQILLNHVKQRRKYLPSSTAPTQQIDDSVSSGQQVVDKPLPQKKDTSDINAMKNYLSELTVYGKPRQQMTYYNHLQRNLSDNVHESQALAFPALSHTTSLVPAGSSSYHYNPTLMNNFSSSHQDYNQQSRIATDQMHSREESPLPSIFAMNEDLKQLSQSILPISSLTHPTTSSLYRR